MNLTEITTRDEIPAWLLKNCLNQNMAEIGVREGIHLQSLLRARPKNLVAVDLWEEDGVPSHNDRGDSAAKIEACYKTVLGLARENPCIHPVRSSSLAASNIFKAGQFDFVYLDADHTYEGAKADIAAWWPKVRPGGVLAGHDYLKAVVGVHKLRIGVMQAVDEFIAATKLSLHTTAAKDRFASWFVAKPLETP